MIQNSCLSIIGYSGHSFVCIELAQAAGFEIDGYYELEEKKFNPYNLTYLGINPDRAIKTELFLAIGENRIRERLFNELRDDVPLSSIIAPDAHISKTAKLGQGNLIGSRAIINPLSVIGDATIINTGSIIEHECEIGDFSHIAPGAVLCGNVQVGKCSLIGANSCIKQGIKIGNNVIIGAGSVVVSDIPDNTTVAGNPGKPFKK